MQLLPRSQWYHVHALGLADEGSCEVGSHKFSVPTLSQLSVSYVIILPLLDSIILPIFL